ncbi:hypothetical protein Syun_030714 [Stephania yunnanensis]|uniref:1-phosphatidylinositol-3-phosphate 5-kinase n=1 Tax=Stephania yunnanensis TaxID=152371 RepID=A0AAP0DZ88_9MAGN
MKYGEDLLRLEVLATPYMTPAISPSISLTSSDSFVSSCSDSLSDEQLPGSREDDSEGSADMSKDCKNSSFLNSTKGINGTGLLNVDIIEDVNNGPDSKIGFDNTLVSRAGDDPEQAGDHINNGSQLNSSNNGTVPSYDFDIDTDHPCIWLPPEPVDLEDDIECSVAYMDDDDECIDGTKWGQSSFLDPFSSQRHGTFRFKEECQRMLTEVMYGEFKNLVSRLLTLVGVPLSGEAGENWVDIVVSLAWEAALLVKPDNIDGRAIDPEGYLKVKCIATGRRGDSHLVKGLAFKKNAALKHMPTEYKNPRLLLLQGMLGQSSSGLSSFDSMEQEKDNVESLVEMIAMCHPNVVLVEKSVSRDVQVALLGKGITLVYDMKLHRLERIARCTGSEIISSVDSLISQKLKQCELFHVDKLIEEHNISEEGGKRTNKALMFLEGFPRPLGCTVLLKGAHSEELKKVKRVVRCTIVMAYRLILDTSFLVGQMAVFSTAPCGFSDEIKKEEAVSSLALLNSTTPWLDVSNGDASTVSMDIPITDDEFQEISSFEGIPKNSNLGWKENLVLSASSHPQIQSYNSEVGQSGRIPPETANDHLLETSNDSALPTIFHEQLLSLLSTSLKKVLGENSSIASSPPLQSFSAYFGGKELIMDYQNDSILPVSTSSKLPNCPNREANNMVREVELYNGQDAEFSSARCEVSQENGRVGAEDTNHLLLMDDFSSVFDAQNILFLTSRQSISRGAICEQSQIRRIKYYRNFDVTLGWYLCNYLLDQRQQCSACGDHSEFHAYSYVHQSGKLTVRVKQISEADRLPGEEEGKIWMWAKCLKCATLNSKKTHTRRVAMSKTVSSLSFGKFLELCFSIYSTSNFLSSCGHSLHQNYLLFYGLGPMVAMFRYSPIYVYTTSMPPPVLEFVNQAGKCFVEKEVEKVLEKGILLFAEVKSKLQEMASGIVVSPSNTYHNQTVPAKKFIDLEEMLKQEKSDFEAFIHSISHRSEPSEQGVYELLSLNRLIQDLVLHSYVWDRRLVLLLSCSSEVVTTDVTNGVCEEPVQLLLLKGEVSGRTKAMDDILHDCDKLSEIRTVALNDPINDGESLISHSEEVELEIRSDETFAGEDENSNGEILGLQSQHENSVLDSIPVNNLSNIDVEANGRLTRGGSCIDGSPLCERTVSTAGRFDKDSFTNQLHFNVPLPVSAKVPLLDEDVQYQSLPICEPLQPERNTQNPEERLRDSDSVIHGSTLSEMSSNSCLQGLDLLVSNSGTSLASDLPNSEGWIWARFSEITKGKRKDLLCGKTPKFSLINGYNPSFLSSANHLITEQGSECQVPLGHEDNVVSSYEGEPTSVIACALALFHNELSSSKYLVGDTRKENREDNASFGLNESVASDCSFTSPSWSSNDSLGSDWSSSKGSVSTEGSYASSFYESNLGDLLLFSRHLHPEIHVGNEKINGKAKYSVVCVYAHLFQALRQRCCSHELDYIASLSRCKDWDAKGGKSGSFFVKTLDDRFIVKQIKKIELESFIKFGPDYFKYINQSLTSGSQTCLAKILGIYQVTIRQNRSGKDIKYDLMVMENILFGRSIRRLYDLKGAQHARYTPKMDVKGKVLLDQNFVEDMNTSPFYVCGRTKHLLQRAVWNDTAFLTSINVMDYSLLVGLDMQKQELVCGIIDYLRQYTWDKHLETWVKASLVVPKNVSPTVVSPKEYKKRFRKFMSMYFLSIPDHWCQDKSSNQNKFSGDSSPLGEVEQVSIG